MPISPRQGAGSSAPIPDHLIRLCALVMLALIITCVLIALKTTGNANGGIPGLTGQWDGAAAVFVLAIVGLTVLNRIATPRDSERG